MQVRQRFSTPFIYQKIEDQRKQTTQQENQNPIAPAPSCPQASNLLIVSAALLKADPQISHSAWKHLPVGLIATNYNCSLLAFSNSLCYLLPLEISALGAVLSKRVKWFSPPNSLMDTWAFCRHSREVKYFSCMRLSSLSPWHCSQS